MKLFRMGRSALSSSHHCFEPIDRTLFDTQPVGHAEGTQRSAPTLEEVVLNELEQPAQSLGQAGIGKHHTESSVELVDGAECTDAAVELGNARAVASEVSPPSPARV